MRCSHVRGNRPVKQMEQGAPSTDDINAGSARAQPPAKTGQLHAAHTRVHGHQICVIHIVITILIYTFFNQLYN
jgi:hypothetical protein